MTVPDRGAEPGRYLKQSEIAEMLGVARLTVWRWIESGELPCVVQGIYRAPYDDRRAYRRKIRRSDFAAFVEKHKLVLADPARPAQVKPPRTKVRRFQPYATTPVVALACGVGEPAAMNMIDRGMIPSVEVPGTRQRRLRRVLREDLIAFLEAHGYGAESLEIARTAW